MKIFVTGGAGFIGRHCVKSFLEKNYQVTIFDNFSNSSEDIISDLLDDGAKLIKGDITRRDEVSNAISGHDIVIHLAAKINVEDSIKFPKETLMTNVDGAINVLNACVKHDVKNIIAASSAAVYGETQNLPISENNKTNPSSLYGESKLKMEEYIQSFSKKHNINSIILRIFNVYGKGQSPEYAGVITKFLNKISKNQPLEIFGDGLQTRDFVSIQDVVESIYCAISKIEGKRGIIFNIGNGKSVSINELAKHMISISNKNLDIKYREEKKDEIRFSQADISLAKKVLNYNPKTGFEDGIKNLMKSM
ncbi:MAG: SDR family NAD(P)-dependent oxidoreductase [Thaumarchaeota archaeon]|nr:SDR family NAD(P)-dependent oxidoreductase [Nitrososphaerota archaeon]